MSSPADTSRISIAANRVSFITLYKPVFSCSSCFQGATGALFGLAIITYLARTYIRTRVLKQFFMEDALLSFAVVCLCATTGMAYASMQNQYDALAAIILYIAGFDAPIPRIMKLDNAATTLWWCVIYPVKLAFLFFFRRLIIRWRNLYRWWWCAMAFTAVALAVSVAAGWLTCPYVTLDGIICE